MNDEQTIHPLAQPAGTQKPPTGAEILARAAEQKAQQEASIEALLTQPLRHSPTLGALAGALAKAQGQITAAARDNKNPFFKSKYASLAAVWDACRDALSANELAIIQPVTVRGRAVVITTMLVHSSGEWIEERLVMIAAQDTPQAAGSTITYGRRYGLAAMVGVAPADDDDGVAGSNTLPPGVRNDKGTGSLQTAPGSSDELPEELPGAGGTSPVGASEAGSPRGGAAAARPTATASPTASGATPSGGAGNPPPSVGTTVSPPPQGARPLARPKGTTPATAAPLTGGAAGTVPPPPGMKPSTRMPGS